MLNLEIKLLIVSGIPILIGLFIGGYIKNFKGFGLELEYNLKEQPIPLKVISNIDMIKSPALEKGTLPELERLDRTEKEKINRLQFITGQRHYYIPEAVNAHFRVLKKIQFIEVVNEKGEFLFVISAKKFKTNAPPLPEPITNMDKVIEFIHAIETENFNNLFFEAVTDYVLTTDSIIEAYRKIKKSEQSRRLFPLKDVLPILNEEKKMIGTVELQKLALTIAEEVEKNIN